MDIRIGIANSPREIAFESKQSSSEIENIVSEALSSESKLIRLADARGTVYVVPTAAFAYLEIGSEESRRVGFVA